MSKKILIIFGFLGILILAFLLRSRIFLTHDFYYLVDQARDLLLVKGIVIDHKLTLIGARTGLGGIFHGPLWLYIISPFFFIFKGDPFLTLVPLFILVSLSLVVLGFYVGWRLYGAYFGLLLALLLTLSSTLVNSILFTSNAQMEPIIVLLYLYSTIEFIRGKDKYFIPSLFFIGLGFQFESAFAFLLIFLTLFAIILRKKLPSYKNIVFGIIAFVIPLSTFLLFDLRHKFLMTTSFIKLFTSPIKPLEGYEKYSSFTFRIFDRITAFKDSFSSPIFENSRFTLLLLFVIILAPIGLWIFAFYKKQKIGLDKEYLFILLSPIIIFSIYVFYPLPLWPHYLFPVSIFIIMLLLQSIRLIYKHNIFKFIIVFFLVMLTFPALLWIKNSYITNSTHAANNSDGSYNNQLKVADWVIKDAGNKDYGYFVYTPGILTYNMDYLIWLESKKNNYKLPVNEKLETTYLIMYPHVAKDSGAYAYWKKNTLKTRGKVILSKVFDGGIVVEKLLMDKNEPSVDANYYQDLIFR